MKQFFMILGIIIISAGVISILIKKLGPFWNPLAIFKKSKIYSEKDESGRVVQIRPLIPGQNSVIRGFIILPEKNDGQRLKETESFHSTTIIGCPQKDNGD